MVHGKHLHWKTVKHRSSKKLSARERGVFVDKKPFVSGGLESSKKGCCFFTNEVLCSHAEEFASGLVGRCLVCSTYKRVNAEMEAEDLRMDAEIEREMRK